jgi:hypothetical protein
MSRKGNCLDNAVSKTSLEYLNQNYFHLKKYNSIDQLKGNKSIHILLQQRKN